MTINLFPYVDAGRLGAITFEAIAEEAEPATRRTLTEAVERGDTLLYGRDDEGYHTVVVAGVAIARVHWTRLAKPGWQGTQN